MATPQNMTAKMMRFCEEYLIDCNATQAAIRAGYSKKSADQIGKENLRKPQIKEYIESIMTEKRKKNIATLDEVLEFLSQGMKGEIKDQFGLDASLNDRIKCAELMGKRYSAFIEKKEINAEVKEIKVTLDD